MMGFEVQPKTIKNIIDDIFSSETKNYQKYSLDDSFWLNLKLSKNIVWYLILYIFDSFNQKLSKTIVW